MHPDAENVLPDLQDVDACEKAVIGADWVFNLACDMGGMGFIESNKGMCILSVLTNTNLLRSAQAADAERYFYSSSACVYAADRQTDPDATALAEGDAYPAMPEGGYGWEKLFSERLCRHFYEDFGIETRVARNHNVYGPHGTWQGGRENVPAAICRKIAEAKRTGDHTIEVWGDGKQTRSLTYIDDWLKGTLMLMGSTVREPLNIGSTEMVTISELVDLVADIAGIKVERQHDLTAPQGVRKSQLRQHDDPGTPRLATKDLPAKGHAGDLRVDRGRD